MPMISRLDAVNTMLIAASERPVSTLEADGVNDTNVADSVLEDVLIEHLVRGLNVNTEELTLTPTAEGRFIITENYLSVDTTENDRDRNVVVIGSYLYDIDNNTDIFDESELQVIVTKYIDFEDLPVGIKIMIRDEAARRYQQLTINDPNMDNVLREREMMSRALGKAIDLSSRDKNYLDKNSFISRKIGLRRRGFYS